MPTNRLNIPPGTQFNRLTVISETTPTKVHRRFVCLCVCGTQTVAQLGSLRSRSVQSCGCLHREVLLAVNTKHGMAGTSIYTSWSMIVQRCTNPKNKAFDRYGGRGIKACDRWLKFENFLADMGERPTPQHSIDRIDNDLGYSPENCKWSTRKEQANNKRNNRPITFDGETLNLNQWMAKLGMKTSTFFSRLNNGWTLEKTLSTPVKPRGAKK